MHCLALRSERLFYDPTRVGKREAAPFQLWWQQPVLNGGQDGNVVRIQPPLVIEDAALDRALDVVDEALGTVG
jgi:4-aminobutyrate aminotransferase-like enzyme